MRRLLTLLSVLVMTSLILAACGGGPTAAPPATSAPANTVAPAASAAPAETATTAPGSTEGPAPAAQASGYGAITARVRAADKVVCGIHTELPGFGYLDANGRNLGFDIDLCRAVAAAVLGDPEKIEAVPITAADRGPVLQTGEVDMVARNMTWTSKRDAEWGNFTWIMFYDGQGFMVRTDSGIKTMQDMDGATICVTSGTTTEKNLAAAFSDAGLTYQAKIFEDTTAVYGAYEQGQCDVATSDKSQLASVRTGFANPNDHEILDITISKEPLTPAVPHGDDQWFDIVKVVMWGLIDAEELGVTSENVGQMANSDNANIRSLLGTEADWGNGALGLDPTALAQAIKAVGNYGEIYDRYMGPNGLNIPRGPNNLWTNGGLLYAPPIK